jgi:NAD(P)-dependent dehydrogenase (short-subunit alcohol dehydrogenase family)
MTRLNPGGQPLENLIPLGRVGQTSGFYSYLSWRTSRPLIPIEADIANAVMFLFSPAASWINGSVMVRLCVSVRFMQL